MPNFAEIIAALPRKERTDRYKILAALYVLGAHTAPVAAKQVHELCDLHLRKEQPQQIPKNLRRMTGDVEIASKGPPLTWRLTQSGLQKLKATSKLELGTHATTGSYDSDIGVVCALEHPEFTAVMNAINGEASWRELDNPGIPHRWRSPDPC